MSPISQAEPLTQSLAGYTRFFEMTNLDCRDNLIVASSEAIEALQDSMTHRSAAALAISVSAPLVVVGQGDL